jgi:hypothetical protein
MKAGRSHGATAWSAVIAFALALALGIATARCSVDVPLGVDPRSDAAHVDAGDAGEL